MAAIKAHQGGLKLILIMVSPCLAVFLTGMVSSLSECAMGLMLMLILTRTG